MSNPGLGAHIRQTVRAYDEADVLDTFYTTVLLADNAISNSIAHRYKSIKSKQFKEIDNLKIKKLILPELLRLVSSKLLSISVTDKIWEWSELYFDNWVANKLNSTVDVFHGYEHASLESLKRCKQKGIFSIYEQPSAHHLFFKENVLNPLLSSEDYFKNNFSELLDSELSKKRNRRRDEELAIADLILCNSTYVKKTLMYAGIPESKIIVHPLGFPEVKDRKIELKQSLKFIVSGNLSYLKGTHHVLRVWRNNPELFANHKLVCIGSDTLSPTEWKNLPDNVQKINRLTSEEYLKELEQADVLILNTYSDGFGMVMSEAMSNGLAVIGTQNSAATDIIEQDITGRIIQVANETELLESMLWMINNPNELMTMRQNAIQYASKHSWSQFRIDIPSIVEKYFHRITLK